MRSRAEPTKLSIETRAERLRLLEIAEQLFAELGVENTPLQRIVQESGQRNRSALNYHFGSRRDLLARLLAWRTGQLNEWRHQYLDEVEAAGMADDPGMLVRAACQPLLDAVQDLPWGRNYLRVLGQILFNPALAQEELLGADTTSALRRLYGLLDRAMPGLGAETLLARLVWSGDVLVHSLARWCRAEVRAWELAGALDDMYDYMISGLTAPVSLPAAQRGQPLPLSPRAAPSLARWYAAKPG